MANENKLKVIIIGSGLAGLTAASILRPHHQVTVYERGSPSIATGGQGIMIAPNGVKILESIGYDHERAGAVPIQGIRMYDKEGNVKEDVGMSSKPRYGADTLAQKRSDFRDELMRLATMDHGDGEKVEMVFEKAVVWLDAEEGVVRFGDGSTESADVVVVADGVHSRLRNTVLRNDSYAAKKTGLTCYRIAVSTEDAKNALGDLPLPHWWDPNTSQNRSSIIHAGDGTPRMITVYPICNQTYFNLSCIIRTQESTKDATESWNADGDRNKMMEAFGDFGESVCAILSAATEVKVWELQDLEPLPTWVRGRTMLIGDAAHTMTPMQGQGANMSIEDAESLRLLIPGTRREDVTGILKVAESFRRPRVGKILEQTRKSHSTLGVAERLLRNMDFICSYNGIHDAVKASQSEDVPL